MLSVCRPIEQKKSRDPGVYSEQLEQKIRRRRELIAARQMTKKSRSDQVESRKEQVKVQRELEAIRLLDEIVHRVEVCLHSPIQLSYYTIQHTSQPTRFFPELFQFCSLL